MNPSDTAVAKRILVVGPSWVGDMVMAQSLFKAIKKQQPDCRIDVLAPGWSRPLTDRMPEVSRAIDMPLGHGKLGLVQRWRLGKSLRGQYDWSILLPNSWKSALVPYAARIPTRTGWLGEMRYGLLNDARRLDKNKLSMTVQRFAALAGSADTEDIPDIISPGLEVKAGDVFQAMQDLGVVKKARKPVLGLCPGAEYGPAKQWPAEYYGALAKAYQENNWDVWLFGSEKDKGVCAAVNTSAGGSCIDLSGRTSLAQAVDLMSLTDAVASNDSGLMHVAAALNRPLVAIYGSSDPGFTPPLNEKHKIASLGLECSPCFKRECPLGHLKCLRDLPVEQVKVALDEVAA